MTENTGPKQPDSLTELFNQATEALKQRGIESQPPSKSNYMASPELNRKLLDSLFMRPTFLDPVTPDTSCSMFGVDMAAPLFCPALSKPPHMSDEDMVELVRGMGKAGSVMMLGIGGSELLQASIDTGTPVIKIVKPYRDMDLIYKKIKEAESKGCVATGMDIDHFYGFFRDGRSGNANTFGPKNVEEMKQLIASTTLPFIVKGVLSVSDAEKAVEMGASGIIVSNHAGASFDFGLPSVMALPEIAQAVGSWVTVMVDSDFRTGNDVFKGLALGAKAVGFGTSILAASWAGGAAGVEQFLNFISSELQRTMSICGCPTLESINGSLLVTSPKVQKWF